MVTYEKNKRVWCIGKRIDGYHFLYKAKMVGYDLINKAVFVSTKDSSMIEAVPDNDVYAFLKEAQEKLIELLNQELVFLQDRNRALYDAVVKNGRNIAMLESGWVNNSSDIRKLKVWASKRLYKKFNLDEEKPDERTVQTSQKNIPEDKSELDSVSPLEVK